MERSSFCVHCCELVILGEPSTDMCFVLDIIHASPLDVCIFPKSLFPFLVPHAVAPIGIEEDDD